MNTKGKLRFFPFGDVPHWVETERLNDSRIMFYLPGPIAGGDKLPYYLTVDVREKRALVALDGYIISGSLKHPNYVIESTYLKTLAISEGRFRESQCCLPNTVNFGRVSANGKNSVIAEIKRHFLLLGSGKYAYLTLDPDSFAVKHVTFQVRSGKDGWCVERLAIAGDD